jgi:hypothetical protein
VKRVRRLYTLTVRGDHVRDEVGRELDGDRDGNGGGDRVEGFSRLFGDSDGDRDVDHADLDRMLATLGRAAGDPAFLWYLDADADGDVDGLDMAAFNRRRRG